MIDLTPAERETIILTSEADDVASVYTFDKRLKVQLKRLSEKFPELIYPGKKAIEGAVNYIVPKSCIVIYTHIPMRENARQASALKRVLKAEIRGSCPGFGSVRGVHG